MAEISVIAKPGKMATRMFQLLKARRKGDIVLLVLVSFYLVRS